MPLTTEDIGKIAALLAPIDERLETLEVRLNLGFDEVQKQLDGLYKQNEDREHEYLAIREQINRLKRRVDVLEKKSA